MTITAQQVEAWYQETEDLKREVWRLRAALTAIEQHASDDGALDAIVMISRTALSPKDQQG